jgi:DNA replication protein DnaC
MSSNKLLEEYLIKECGIPKKFAKKNWSDYTAPDKKALEKAKSYASMYSTLKKEGTGMYLFGVNGSGKTLLACLIAKEVSNNFSNAVRFANFTEICTIFSDGYQDAETRAITMKALKNAGLLILDNLPGTSSQVMSIKTLVPILTSRLQNDKPTIITSTIAPSDIGKALSEDIQSMLKESCITLYVDNSDFRDIIKPTLN